MVDFILGLLSGTGMPEWLQTVIWTIIKILAIIAPIMGVTAYIILAERKILGYVQLRPGPIRVGPWGLLQPVADGLKLIMKETIVPTNANKFLFLIAPALTFTPIIAAYAVVPFDKDLVLSGMDAGLLYILAITSMSVYGIIASGWSSNSKYAFLGTLRSSAQVISYEIAMGFALVVVLMAGGSLNLVDIVEAQSGSVFHWFLLPLFPMFLVYFISGVAETNRPPFDMAEGESEIVAGFHVEYSGIMFGVFMLGEYIAMILISLLTSLMFFGGWLSPFQGIPGLEDLFAWVPGVGWLAFKALFFMFVYIWLRATFPRYRYDQIMRLGWKVFIPITIVWILVVGLMIMGEVGPWFD